jgi:hypothetical protein
MPCDCRTGRSHCLTQAAKPQGARTAETASALGYGCWRRRRAGKGVCWTLSRRPLLDAWRQHRSRRDNGRGREAGQCNGQCAGAALRAGTATVLGVALTFALLGVPGRVMCRMLRPALVLGGRGRSSPAPMRRVRRAGMDRLRDAQVQGEPQSKHRCYDSAGRTTHGFNLDSFRPESQERGRSGMGEPASSR